MGSGEALKKPPKRVVLDTNVLISALLFSGRASEILDLLENNVIALVISKEILNEYVTALAYPKFSLSEKEIKSLINDFVLPYAEIVSPRKLPEPVCRDPKDDKFLACAKAAKADAIVSGDKHLLMLKEFEHILIVTVTAFLQAHKEETGK